MKSKKQNYIAVCTKQNIKKNRTMKFSKFLKFQYYIITLQFMINIINYTSIKTIKKNFNNVQGWIYLKGHHKYCETYNNFITFIFIIITANRYNMTCLTNWVEYCLTLPLGAEKFGRKYRVMFGSQETLRRNKPI